jgi:hypothetical protein
MSNRETVIENIVSLLKDMDDPKPILVSREPFDVEKLAITQFPAILVQSGDEIRFDTAMRSREGQINYVIRSFVRGVELDKKKNEIVERIEETLDADRKRGTTNFSMKTQVISVIPVDRLAPLGEVLVTVQVQYKYPRGTT